jgi:hypothetical protein
VVESRLEEFTGSPAEGSSYETARGQPMSSRSVLGLGPMSATRNSIVDVATPEIAARWPDAPRWGMKSGVPMRGGRDKG